MLRIHVQFENYEFQFFARLESKKIKSFNYFSSIPILNTFDMLNTYETVKMIEKNWRAVVIFKRSFAAVRLEFMVF